MHIGTNMNKIPSLGLQFVCIHIHIYKYIRHTPPPPPHDPHLWLVFLSSSLSDFLRFPRKEAVKNVPEFKRLFFLSHIKTPVFLCAFCF